MSIIRKLSVLALTAFFAGAAFSGCGGAGQTSSDAGQEEGTVAGKVLTGGGSKVIYIITPARSNPFFRAETEAAAAKAKELGYEVRSSFHDEDETKQSELFDNAISDKAAAIICDHADAGAVEEEIRKARRANIPTFLIDRGIKTEGLAVSRIMANNVQGAKGIAEKFAEAMGKKGQYIELLGIESDPNAQFRSKAFHEVLDRYPEMELVGRETANWEQMEAAQITETFLQTYPELKGIICGNDTMAIGALESVRNAGLTDIAVVGVDGSDEAAAAIKSGSMTGTALQQAALMAEMAVEQADAYLRDGTTGKPERQLVDCVIITKENVDRLKGFVYK